MTEQSEDVLQIRSNGYSSIFEIIGGLYNRLNTGSHVCTLRIKDRRALVRWKVKLEQATHVLPHVKVPSPEALDRADMQKDDIPNLYEYDFTKWSRNDEKKDPQATSEDSEAELESVPVHSKKQEEEIFSTEELLSRSETTEMASFLEVHDTQHLRKGFFVLSKYGHLIWYTYPFLKVCPEILPLTFQEDKIEAIINLDGCILVYVSA